MSYIVRSSSDKKLFEEARGHIADHLRTAALSAAFQVTLETRNEPTPVTFCLAVRLARGALYQAALELATHPLKMVDIQR
jgi:hypothetical protein